MLQISRYLEKVVKKNGWRRPANAKRFVFSSKRKKHGENNYLMSRLIITTDYLLEFSILAVVEPQLDNLMFTVILLTASAGRRDDF